MCFEYVLSQYCCGKQYKRHDKLYYLQFSVFAFTVFMAVIMVVMMFMFMMMFHNIAPTQKYAPFPVL